MSNKAPRNSYPKDYLAQVDGYDLARGVMLATSLGSGRKLEVSIPASAPINQSDRPLKFQGDQIDVSMAQELAPGSNVILMGCQSQPDVSKDKSLPIQISAKWISRALSSKINADVFTVRTSPLPKPPTP